MDRQIVYTGQIPLDTDMLGTNKDAYIGLAKLTAGVLGTSSLLNAFTCIPTAPASLQVQVTAGEIYSLQNIDNTTYGSLASDTTHQIVKQGVILNTTTLNCPAPGTSGQSINYLIQIGFSETDTGSTVLPYYNSSNPAQPYSGPNNSGQPNNTIRQDSVTIQAKAGTAATTGTQTTPAPDSGFVGAFVVTVANGQTQINSGNITTYSGAPFILETLTQKISQTTADARYAQQTQVQSGLLLYGIDTSVSANTITANLSPALTSYGTGGMLFYIKIANTNTGASTVNLNSLGAKNIKLTNGSNPAAGDMPAGGESLFLYDGTNVQLLNPASLTSSSVQSGSFNYAADTGSANAYVATFSPALTAYTAGTRYYVKISNTNTGASTANFNSLGAKNITLTNSAALNPGNMVANMIAEFLYDGTNMQLMNPAPTTNSYAGGVVNGGMIVAQRPVATLAVNTFAYGAVDAMAGQAAGTAVSAGTFTQSTSAPVGSTGYAAQFSGVTVTGSGVISLRHRIESREAIKYKNLQGSITCKVYHDVGSAINYTITVRKANTQDNFSAVTVVSTSSGISVNSATATEIKFENISMGDVSNGIEIQIDAACGAVTTKNFYFTELQLNVGSYAMSFIKIPFVEEINRCSRRYTKSNNYSSAPGTLENCYVSICASNSIVGGWTYSARFPVRMRTAPTVTIYSTFNSAVGNISSGGANIAGAVTNICDGGCIIYNNATVTDGQTYSCQYSADADF